MPCIVIPSIFRWGTAWLVWLLKPGLDLVWRNPRADVLTSGCPWKLQGMRVRATCRDAVQAGVSTKVIFLKKLQISSWFYGEKLEEVRSGA